VRAGEKRGQGGRWGRQRKGKRRRRNDEKRMLGNEGKWEDESRGMK